MTNNNFRRLNLPDGWYWGLFFPNLEPVHVIDGEVWRVSWEKMKQQEGVRLGLRIPTPGETGNPPLYSADRGRELANILEALDCAFQGDVCFAHDERAQNAAVVVFRDKEEYEAAVEAMGFKPEGKGSDEKH